MSGMVRAVAAVLAAALAGAAPAGAGTAGPRLPPAEAPSQVAAPAPSPQRALLDRYCVTCHNQRLQTGGLALDAADVSHVGDAPDVWERVVLKLRGGMMPPAGRPRPAGAALDELRGWLETELDRAAAATVEPGRVPTHRLNRAEYANAVRDLLALDIDAEALLPADDTGHGFDNLAGTLALSPALMETLPVGGPAHQPPRRRRPRDRAGPDLAHVHRPHRDGPERPHERGAAVRVARRARGAASLSPRRRVRPHRPPEAERLRVHRQPRRGARPRRAGRRPAGGPVHRRRRRAGEAGAGQLLGHVRGGGGLGLPDPGLGRLPHRGRRGPRGARSGAGRRPRGRGGVRRQVVGARGGAPARAPGVRRHRHRDHRHVAPARGARAGERHHRRALRGDGTGRDREPVPHLRLPAGRRGRRGGGLRPDHSRPPRAARIPPARRRGRPRAAAGLLSGGPGPVPGWSGRRPGWWCRRPGWRSRRPRGRSLRPVRDRHPGRDRAAADRPPSSCSASSATLSARPPARRIG